MIILNNIFNLKPVNVDVSHEAYFVGYLTKLYFLIFFNVHYLGWHLDFLFLINKQLINFDGIFWEQSGQLFYLQDVYYENNKNIMFLFISKLKKLKKTLNPCMHIFNSSTILLRTEPEKSRLTLPAQRSFLFPVSL